MITVECDKLIKTLNKAQKSLEKPDSQGALRNYLYDMWRVGKDEATRAYDSAVTVEGEKANEHTTIVSDANIRGNGFELTATGEDVTFLEFGTGLIVDYDNPYASKFGFAPGSYSKDHGQFLQMPRFKHFQGQWPHGGKLHWGQAPAKGMYNAYKAMEEYTRTTPLRIFQ